MRLIIREDELRVSYYVAIYIKNSIIQFNPTKENPFVLGLPDSTIQPQIFQFLIAFHKNQLLSFENVVAFCTDEFVGISCEHPASSYLFFYNCFFKHVDILPHNIIYFDGKTDNLSEECRKYEQKLTAFGGFELLLASIGPDGHIAFNEPGSSLSSITRIKTVAYETILANTSLFDNDVSKVPKLSLTIGVSNIVEAKEIVIPITGASNALALSKCIEGEFNHMWVVSAVQVHPAALIVCDENATLELLVKTVKYYKSIERVQKHMIGNEKIHRRGNISSLSTPKQSSSFTNPYSRDRPAPSPILPSASTTNNTTANADSTQFDTNHSDNHCFDFISRSSIQNNTHLLPPNSTTNTLSLLPIETIPDSHLVPVTIADHNNSTSSLSNIYQSAQQPSSSRQNRNDYTRLWWEYQDQFNYFYNCHFVNTSYSGLEVLAHHQTSSSHQNSNTAHVPLNNDLLESSSSEE
ncbi:hypothetical protein BB561_005704 [Smittium simulii]|uniref:glucosamine-6-phosphate deaminase n=1 Tax=Smittium simulii TaxID=133385 RepID=A0A2T9Y8X3_9FUNG|nr:hypothetical protein BB561_005704 [Smittium simulii]